MARHGTVSRYNGKDRCRCDRCTAAIRDYRRALRAKNTPAEAVAESSPRREVSQPTRLASIPARHVTTIRQPIIPRSRAAMTTTTRPPLRAADDPFDQYGQALSAYLAGEGPSPTLSYPGGPTLQRAGVERGRTSITGRG